MSLLTMITTLEKATQKSITLPTLSVHHTSFLWALCHELALYNPPIRGPIRRRLALLRDLPPKPQLPKALAGQARVVTAVEVDARLIGQSSQRLGSRLQGGDQKRRVVAVGGGGNGPQRDALGVHRHRALWATFSAVHRASPGLLTHARGLGHAAVHRDLRELQADEAVVCLQADPPEPLHHSELDPLVAPAPKGALRAGRIGDPLVGAAEDQNLDQLLEDDPL